MDQETGRKFIFTDYVEAWGGPVIAYTIQYSIYLQSTHAVLGI